MGSETISYLTWCIFSLQGRTNLTNKSCNVLLKEINSTVNIIADHESLGIKYSSSIKLLNSLIPNRRDIIMHVKGIPKAIMKH